MSRRSAEAHARIVEEIVREKAATLGRAGERLEAALAEVAEIARAWRAAETARQTLLIQREAVGLRHHRDVDQQFPRPPRRLSP